MGKTEQKTMKIVQKPIFELTPAEYNPRQLSESQFTDLQNSFKNLGTLEPAVINQFPGRENVIISGHQRLKVAESLGMTEYPCYEVNFPLEKEKEANIRMNRNTGEWDWDMLANNFEVEELKEWGFEDLNFLVEPEEGLTDEDEVPEAPEEPKTKPGDLYILGEHRLLCGDSTSIDAVERLMDGQLCDQFITDPPYNVDYTGKTKDALKIENDKKDDTNFRQFLKDAFVSADTAMKPGAVFYIWHADLEGYNFRGACHDINWKVRQCLIWNKNSMVMGRQDYHWKHEPCLYGWKEGDSHLWASDRKQVTVIDFDRRMQNKEHPTMKPVGLIEYQIKNNTKQMDMVLDLFGGSGSTLIACQKTSRKCCMMELDPKYCDVIVKRWEDFTGKKAELLKEELAYG